MTARWGVAGPGPVADKVMRDPTHVPHAGLTAVALVDDPDLDVIYVATPHPRHRALTLAALDAGKAVLVEKSFTVISAGARAPWTGHTSDTTLSDSKSRRRTSGITGFLGQTGLTVGSRPP